MTVDDYLCLPWTIRATKHDDDGYYTALTVDELPGFLVAGRERHALEREFWTALRTFIQCMLDDGDPVPVPPPRGQWTMIIGPALA